MLDDSKIIQQRDPQQALEVAANQWQQAAAKVEIYNAAHDHRKINNGANTSVPIVASVTRAK